MVNLDKLQDEAYALKVLIELINKYLTTDSEKVESINIVASTHGCIPGRAIGRIFYQKGLSEDDTKVIQEIINIYA